MKKRSRQTRAFTLLELIVVTAIFGILFSVLVGLMLNSDLFFSKGQNKITEHMEARKIIDVLSKNIRASSPDWVINGTHHYLAVSANFTRLDYYVPDFDSNNTIAGVRKITYKIDPGNPRNLLMRNGTEPYTVVSGIVSSVAFGCGCAGCSSFSCSYPASDCPMVSLQVTTLKDNQFHLSTEIKLQNQVQTLPAGDPVDEPQEGEF